MLAVSAHQLASLLEPGGEQRVRSQALSFDYSKGDLVDGALHVARVLLYPGAGQGKPHLKLHNVTDTAYECWAEKKIERKPYHANVLTNWVTVGRNDFGQYPIFLFNRNYGKTRKVLHATLTWDEAPPPYLYLVFMNAFRQALGMSHDEKTISADGKRRTADNTTRQAFLERQRAVVYLPFNVLSDSLPSNAESYGIVSTGFMTSTVRPHERQGGWKVRGAGLAHLGLSLHAVIRVVELAQKGKTVDLFTVQRASSRVFKYKTAFLAWRNGRLVDLITTTDNSRNRWTRTALDAIRQRINPSFRRYCKFLPSQ